jgi:hypothetical protein
VGEELCFWHLVDGNEIVAADEAELAEREEQVRRLARAALLPTP